MKLPVKSLAMLVSLVAAGSAVADVNSYGLPFAENSAGGQQSGAAKSTLSVDEGLILGNATGSNEPVVVPAGKPAVNNSKGATSDLANHTATAGASRNANSRDNPAVDGTNVQPVPNKVVQPIRLTDDVIPSRQEIIVEPGVNTLIPIALLSRSSS